jgi:MFS family permease
MTKPGSRTLFNVSSFQVLTMFRRGLFYTYLSVYLRAFLGLSVTETTFFATFPMIVNVLFASFVWGVMSDRRQKRRTFIIVGEICAALITFLVWYVHSMAGTPRQAGYVIIIGLIVVEVFWSMSNVAWSALISDLYAQYERASVQGKLASVGAVGRMVGVWLGALAYDGMARYYEGWGFQEGLLFFVASGVMLLSTIPMLFVPEGGIGPVGRRRPPAAGLAGLAEGVGKCYGKFLWFLAAMVLINFGRNSIAVVRTQYLVLDEGFDVSSRMLGNIVNMHSIAIFVFGLVIGRLSRRLADGTLLLLGALGAALSVLGFGLFRQIPLVFASSFTTGVADVVILAASYSYAARLIPPEHRGKQFALFNATLFLSWGTAGTLIVGPLVDLLIGRGWGQVSAYRMSFVAAAVMVGAGIVLLAKVNRMPDPGISGEAPGCPTQSG